MYHNGFDSIASMLVMLACAWPAVRHTEWLFGVESTPKSLLPLLAVVVAAAAVWVVWGDMLHTTRLLAIFTVLFLAPAFATSELLNRYRLRAAG